MKYYDYTYLTRPDMPEDEAQALQNKLVEMIAAQSGAITDLPKAYKKRLAYRIKKQDAAYVNTILFQAEPGNAVDFKKQTDAMPEILRGLIVAYDPEKLKKEVRRERPMAAKTAEPEIAPAVEPAPAVEESKSVVEEKPAKKAKIEQKEQKTEEKPKEKEERKEEKKEEPKAKSKEEKKEPAEEKPAKPKRRTKIKAELRDIEEKLDEILK